MQRLLGEEGIRCSLGSFPADHLADADEIFITSTLKGVLPAVSLDGQPVGNGTPGELTRRLMALYERETSA